MRFVAVLALSCAAVSFSASAQQFDPKDWEEAHPVTAVSVSRTAQADVYRVSAVITDARTSKVLARPVLLIKQGTAGTIEVGAQAGTLVRLILTVDHSGGFANFRNEVLKDGSIQSGQSGALAVGNET